MPPKKGRHHEIHARTIVKTITWKILATAIAFWLTYYYTGSFETSGKLALFTFFTGLVAYYLHERAWNAIHWGRESRD